MALVKCGECLKEVSDRANFCPHCGNPFSNSKDETVTIQLQKKKWKLQKFIAGTFVIFGWLLFISGLLNGDPTTIGIGGLLLFIGLIWTIVAKIGSWWSTG